MQQHPATPPASVPPSSREDTPPAPQDTQTQASPEHTQTQACPEDTQTHACPEDTTAQAGRFERARVARSAVLAEDYVELIAALRASDGEARTVDIARCQGVSHATVIKTLARLRREGLVSGRRYRGLFLTAAGQALAERVRARHRVVVALLVAVGVPLPDAEADAEGIEHHVSAATLAAFSRFLEGGPQG